ncbi:hypothetical protein D1007_60731 [Hordeum vulgare]|nr:hypothetical protein D1007_60731 [Hordeum vulgare]
MIRTIRPRMLFFVSPMDTSFTYHVLDRLRETKLGNFTDAIRVELRGPGLRGFAKVPANGTRGGILLLWDDSKFVVDSASSGDYSITARMVTRQGLEQPWCLTMDKLAELVEDHFEGIMETPTSTTAMYNWERLGLSRHNLQELDAPFMIAEIKEAIWDLPPEKAPGSDGFSSYFYRSCWDIIKTNLLLAFQRLFDLNARTLHRCNDSIVVLIPKETNSGSIEDFRPIILKHSLIKIFMKLLARRLTP